MISRSVTAAASVSVAVSGLLVLGPGASLPAVAADPGKTCVQLVLSPGPLGGSTTADCVTVPAGANGLDVLRAGGHSLRFDDSGLICAIDGRPAGGCGETTSGGKFAFWSYWWRSDNGSWRFANLGPGGRKVPANGKQAEGWSYNDGSGSQRSAQPALIGYDTTCTKAATVPGPTGAPPAPPTKAPVPAKKPVSTKAPAPPTAGPTRPAAKPPGRPAPVPSSSGRPPGGALPTGPVPGRPGSGESLPGATAPGATSAGATAPGSPTPTTAAPGTSAPTSDAPSSAALSADTQSFDAQPGETGGVSPLVTVLGVAVGAALLAVAALVARRRRAGGSDIGTPGPP